MGARRPPLAQRRQPRGARLGAGRGGRALRRGDQDRGQPAACRPSASAWSWICIWRSVRSPWARADMPPRRAWRCIGGPSRSYMPSAMRLRAAHADDGACSTCTMAGPSSPRRWHSRRGFRVLAERHGIDLGRAYGLVAQTHAAMGAFAEAAARVRAQPGDLTRDAGGCCDVDVFGSQHVISLAFRSGVLFALGPRRGRPGLDGRRHRARTPRWSTPCRLRWRSSPIC